MSALRSIRLASLPVLSAVAALAVGACSDSPSALKNDGTEELPLVHDLGTPPLIEPPVLGHDNAAASVAPNSALVSQSLQALGTATSYGFVCSSTYHWVRNNWPNMTSISGAIENTYFLSVLYRWNGSTWVSVANRGWYAGASNGSGRLPLGNIGVVPYYWLLNGGVVVDQGAIFGNLASGYYKTAEYYYWQNGSNASRWSFVNGSGASYCRI